MDEFRTFMTGRQTPFRLKGLRAIFVTPEDDLDEEEKVCVCVYKIHRCVSNPCV